MTNNYLNNYILVQIIVSLFFVFKIPWPLCLKVCEFQKKIQKMLHPNGDELSGRLPTTKGPHQSIYLSIYLPIYLYNDLPDGALQSIQW